MCDIEKIDFNEICDEHLDLAFFRLLTTFSKKMGLSVINMHSHVSKAIDLEIGSES